MGNRVEKEFGKAGYFTKEVEARERKEKVGGEEGRRRGKRRL